MKGEALKRIRKNLKQTQEEFSKNLEVSQSFYNRIENNKRKPNLKMIMILAYKYNICFFSYVRDLAEINETRNSNR